jgi:hypothetical protein
VIMLFLGGDFHRGLKPRLFKARLIQRVLEIRAFLPMTASMDGAPRV